MVDHVSRVNTGVEVVELTDLLLLQDLSMEVRRLWRKEPESFLEECRRSLLLMGEDESCARWRVLA